MQYDNLATNSSSVPDGCDGGKCADVDNADMTASGGLPYLILIITLVLCSILLATIALIIIVVVTRHRRRAKIEEKISFTIKCHVCDTTVFFSLRIMSSPTPFQIRHLIGKRNRAEMVRRHPHLWINILGSNSGTKFSSNLRSKRKPLDHK
ncbi:hypothetical protein RRG08_060076 [Elysia crispata]|uniref:Uncharacterized protein n=1 Tax=Elysia crispata TaxID=231223 RepID=A0AAE0Y097_9GAST|nr:hypothetical protein RRG08_060076 [Elysia crispata]